MYAFFPDYFCFMHLFHGVDALGFFEFDRPHLTESSLSNHVLTVKGLAPNLLVLSFSFFFSSLQLG